MTGDARLGKVTQRHHREIRNHREYGQRVGDGAKKFQGKVALTARFNFRTARSSRFCDVAYSAASY